MSGDSHEHSMPEVHPDTDDYGAVQKLILSALIFVAASIVFVNFYLDYEIDRVLEARVSENAQE